MKTQLTKRSLIALALIAMLATSAGAVVLHDQSAYSFGPGEPGFLNRIASSPLGNEEFYSVNDVTVGGTGWIIEEITIFVEALGGYQVSMAHVHIFDKTGALPTDIPTDGLPRPATSIEFEPNKFAVTVSGLSIPVSPGNYWVGLTPAESPFNTSVLMPATDFVGDATPTYDANGIPLPMWTNWVPETDATILIQGDDQQVVGTENLSMGSVKALFR